MPVHGISAWIFEPIHALYVGASVVPLLGGVTDGATSRDRLTAIALDETSISPGTADQEHERRVAIYDLLEANSFALPGCARGPYHLLIGLQDAKLAFHVRTEDGELVILHLLALQPFRRLLRDYMLVCESYVAAIRSATPDQIQAIDMGRRGLHNEAAERLAERLDGKIAADFDTFRRLFTLLTALHWKG